MQHQDRTPVPCSHRIWSLAVPHGIPGRRGYSGGERVHPWGGLVFIKTVFRRGQFVFEGNTTAFLMPRTTPRGFFAIPTTHRANSFSALEGLLRPGALAPIGVNT
jgi:hypothetical protein